MADLVRCYKVTVEEPEQHAGEMFFPSGADLTAWLEIFWRTAEPFRGKIESVDLTEEEVWGPRDTLENLGLDVL